MALQDAIISALGGSAGDSETISLVETIVSNANAGLDGVPNLSFLPSFGGGGGASAGGFGLAAFNPYLRIFIFQQENPYVIPGIAAGIVVLAFIGLADLL